MLFAVWRQTPLSRWAASVIVTLALALPALALAAERLTLDPVQVKAVGLEESLPAELSKYGNDLEVISRDELDQTGMADVGQALERLVPGLYIAPKNGRADYVDASLHGSRTDDILWLVDGVRINNRLFGGSTPLDSLSTVMIERIEILQGGQALFFGTQAIAGVINIVLREPSEEAGGGFRLGAGGFLERRVGGHVTDGLLGGEWLLFADHQEAEGFQPFVDEAYEPDARKVDRGYQRTNVGGKYRRRFGDGRKLALYFQRNDAEADFARPYNNFKAFNDRDEHIASLKWEHWLTDRSGYFVKAYWHEWWTDYTRLSMDSNGDVTVENDRDRWGYEDYGVNVMGRHVGESGSEVLAGVDYQRYWGEDFVLRIDRREESVAAVFAQYRPVLGVLPETALALGGRYNHAEFGGDGFVWNISGARPLGGGVGLRGEVGTAFRLPSAFELFVIDPAFPAGNEDLDAERSIGGHLSLHGRHGLGVSWELGGFYREIKDLIGVQGGTFVNTAETVFVRGGEAQLRIGGQAGWYIQTNATYAQATTAKADEQIDEIPRTVAKLKLGWDQAQGRYGAALTGLDVGRVYKTLPSTGRQRYGDYTVLDLSGYWALGGQDRHRLSVRLENLADAEYATQLGEGERVAGGAYRYENRGVPRSVQVDYRYRF